jgi:RNA polymerase sigma factor (TIGR02999 family)
MDEIIVLLERARGGDDAAWQRVVALLYDDLLRLARCASTAGRANTLNATSLVHECYLRIAKQGAASISSREHFLALAGRAMRQILVNHARDRVAAKRGGGATLAPVGDVGIAAEQEAEELLGLDTALEQLAQQDERLVRVVDCRMFGGLSETETAVALDLPPPTVERLWSQARERLQALLAV